MILEKGREGCEVSMEEPPFMGGDDVELIEEDVAGAVVRLRLPLVVASGASSEVVGEMSVVDENEAKESEAKESEANEEEEVVEEIPRPMKELVVECGDKDLVLSVPKVMVEVLEQVAEESSLEEKEVESEVDGGRWEVVKRKMVEEKRVEVRERKERLRREIAVGQQVWRLRKREFESSGVARKVVAEGSKDAVPWASSEVSGK